uniref:Uncharacterized protein n=1 Tax=Opuntia streptacantha TaxID=393608 RepID=A0A7C8ZJK7_OPUST
MYRIKISQTPTRKLLCKLPPVLNITGDRKSILAEQAMELPFRHGVVLGLIVLWIVQWHLKETLHLPIPSLVISIHIHACFFPTYSLHHFLLSLMISQEQDGTNL